MHLRRTKPYPRRPRQSSASTSVHPSRASRAMRFTYSPMPDRFRLWSRPFNGYSLATRSCCSPVAASRLASPEWCFHRSRSYQTLYRGKSYTILLQLQRELLVSPAIFGRVNSAGPNITSSTHWLCSHSLSRSCSMLGLYGLSIQLPKWP